MGNFLASFQEGPVNGQVFFVGGDDGGPADRPARWQQFRRVLTNRFGLRTGRVGIFLYELTNLEPIPSMVWTYRYVQYGEEFDAIQEYSGFEC